MSCYHYTRPINPHYRLDKIINIFTVYTWILLSMLTSIANQSLKSYTLYDHSKGK